VTAGRDDFAEKHMSANQQIQTKPKQLPTIREQLEGPKFAAAVAKSLPKHLNADRFLRIATTALTRTPKLAQCDQASFFGALLTLSQLGIEPDGRRAHLIPFENRKRGVTECQLIIDYKGLAELAMRSGLISNLHADVIRDGDLFEYSAGEVSKHVPWFLRRGDRPASAGDVIAVYAISRFRDGSSKAEVMSVEDVESIRKRSRAANAGPWVTDWEEMAKKTVFRRLSKWLPLSPEFRDAVEADEEPQPAIEVPAVKVEPLEIGEMHAGTHEPELGISEDTQAKLAEILGNRIPEALAWLKRAEWIGADDGIEDLSEANAKSILDKPAEFLAALDKAKGGTK
jgi:recombination protein RecT